MYKTSFPTAMLSMQQGNTGKLIFTSELAQSWPRDSSSQQPGHTHHIHLVVAVAYVQAEQPLINLPGFYGYSANNYLASVAVTTELCIESSSRLRSTWTWHLPAWESNRGTVRKQAEHHLYLSPAALRKNILWIASWGQQSRIWP